MYSVKIKATGKYVRHCDDCWYETSSDELRLYTKEEAEAVAKKMRKHYVYTVEISDGTETYEVSSLKKPIPFNVAVSAESEWGDCPW